MEGRLTVAEALQQCIAVVDGGTYVAVYARDEVVIDGNLTRDQLRRIAAILDQVDP